jgi:hypothetical protein
MGERQLDLIQGQVDSMVTRSGRWKVARLAEAVAELL